MANWKLTVNISKEIKDLKKFTENLNEATRYKTRDEAKDAQQKVMDELGIDMQIYLL